MTLKRSCRGKGREAQEGSSSIVSHENPKEDPNGEGSKEKGGVNVIDDY